MDIYLQGWLLSLEADNYPPLTVKTYSQAIRHFLASVEKPANEITSNDIRNWIIELHNTLSQNTIHTRLTIVRAFYKWLVREGDISTNPTDRIKGPPRQQPQTPVLSDDDIAQLLSTTKTGKFVDIRDNALLRLFLDTGVRLSEMITLDLDDIDILQGTVVVNGKGKARTGKRHRITQMGTKTSLALARYLRERQHRTTTNRLWISVQGRAMTQNTLYSVIKRRGLSVGLHLYPHMLRHVFADRFRANGGSEGDLLVLGGWESRQMLDRYGRGNAESRAREAARRLSIGDQF